MSVEARPRSFGWPLAVGLTAVGLCLLVAILMSLGVISVPLPGGNDADVSQRLKDMSAIVVMDPTRTYVSSVNLSLISEPQQVSEALTLLADCRRISSLDISGTSVADADLVQVGKLRSLANLTINGCAIGDAGVEHLGRLSNLEALYVADTQCSSASIAAIAGLKRLRMLDLSGTQVTGGLQPLSRLPQLDWLLLRNLTLQDGSLAELAACRQLTRLSLENSKIDQPQALQALKDGKAGLQSDQSAPAGEDATPPEDAPADAG